jgi:hypothetical protein
MLWIIGFAGSKERKCSSTILQARQVWWWQAEEEGQIHTTIYTYIHTYRRYCCCILLFLCYSSSVSFFFFFCYCEVCYCFCGYLVEMRNGFYSICLFMSNFVGNRSGARESRRRRGTTWCCSTKQPMTSFWLRLPNTSSSPPPFSPTVRGYKFVDFLFLLIYHAFVCGYRW